MEKVLLRVGCIKYPSVVRIAMIATRSFSEMRRKGFVFPEYAWYRISLNKID